MQNPALGEATIEDPRTGYPFPDLMPVTDSIVSWVLWAEADFQTPLFPHGLIPDFDWTPSATITNARSRAGTTGLLSRIHGRCKDMAITST